MTSQIYAGVDEVGRGCLAGPVISAAIILKSEVNRDLLVDSKKISQKKRAELANYILNNSISIGIGVCSSNTIDKINIHHATLLSMKRAIFNLTINPSKILVDGIHSPQTGIDTEAIIKGDDCIPEISAASIVAKVVRDNYMISLDSILFGYGFDKHKGYPTKDHIEALKLLGPSIHHRITFKHVNQLHKII